MRVGVSSLPGSRRRPAVKKGDLVLPQGRDHCLRRPDKTPKSPQAGTQIVAQSLEGENVEGDEQPRRPSFHFATFLDAYGVVGSGGHRDKF